VCQTRAVADRLSRTARHIRELAGSSLAEPGIRAAGSHKLDRWGAARSQAEGPMTDSRAVGTREDRNRAGGNPGSPGNQAAVRSPGRAAVVVGHERRSPPHRFALHRRRRIMAPYCRAPDHFSTSRDARGVTAATR
jgi:hypothetical protein